MDNQHRHIKGYRELSPLEVAQMNQVKDTAEMVNKIVEAMERDPSSFDPRWVAIAKTDLQKGFMALTRSIAKPTSF